MGTNCLRPTSYHKWLGVLFSLHHFLCPGILSCEKQTLCRGLFFCCCCCCFFRKKAGSGTALSHHSKFLTLRAFDFVLGLSGFTEKRSSLDSPSFPLPSLHLSATASAQSTGTEDGSDLTEAGTDFQGWKCTAATQAWTAPPFSSTHVAGQTKNVLLFVC